MVGTLGKFPNWHLFWSKFHFSIVKLWSTIEILFSTQLSIKSIFSNIISIGYWWNFTLGHILCSISHLLLCQTGNFHYFPHHLACWPSKPWHFTKFCLLLHFVQQFKVLYMVKWEISTISLSVWHVGYKSQGILQNFAIFPPKSAIS